MAVTAYTFPTQVSHISGNGWTTLTNILADDGNYARSSDAGGETMIRMWTYNFDLPNTATIDGIEVEYEDRTPSFVQNTNRFGAIKAGASIAETYINPGAATTTSIRTLGTPTCLWGTTWTVANIEANGTSGFGMFIYITGLNFSTTHDFDYHATRIYYTDTGGGGGGSTFKPWWPRLNRLGGTGFYGFSA